MFNFLTVVSLSKDKTDKSVKAFLTCVVLKKTSTVQNCFSIHRSFQIYDMVTKIYFTVLYSRRAQ